MQSRKILTMVVAALAAAACSDQPTPTEAPLESEAQLAQGPVVSNLLSDIPVTGALPGGGSFEGLLSITEIAIENGQLVASGVLEGTATQGGVVTEITQTFTDVVLGLTGSGSGGSCDILNLDLGPLNLDLLGLVVDLSAVSLDITAVRGPGKLLGNLLCAVAGLLDGGGPLSGLLDLLDQINSILG